MARELTYKIGFETDISGASSVSAALESINARASSVGNSARTMGEVTRGSAEASAASLRIMSGTVNGLDSALQGNTQSALGAAQAIMMMGRALAASNPIFAIVTIALLAINKGLGMLTEKEDAASKASQESADKAAAFSKSLNELRSKQQEVAYSIEKQCSWLEKLGGYYDHATQSADKLTAAQKKSSAAATGIEKAGVDIEEADALLRAGKNVPAANRAKTTAETKRADIDIRAASRDLSFDRTAIQRKITATGETMQDLTRSRATPPDIAIAREKLDSLRSQRQGARQDPDRYIALSTQIIALEGKLKELNKQEQERTDKIDEQLNAKNNILQQLQIDLTDNDKLRTTLDLQLEATRKRLQLQRQVNAENEKAEASAARQKNLEDQKKALSDKIATAQKAAADALTTAKEAETKTADKAKQGWARAMDPKAAKTPEEQIAEAEARDKKGLHSTRDKAILANRKRILAGEDIDDVAQRGTALGRARDAKDRGIRGGSIERVLDANKAQAAADEAKLKRQQLEAKQALGFGAMQITLDAIKTNLEKTLQIGGAGV